MTPNFLRLVDSQLSKLLRTVKKFNLNAGFRTALLIVGLVSALLSSAQDASIARPVQVLQENTLNMPKSEKQEIRVFTATIKPGGKTPFHTHRYPVTVYMLEGTFTLEIEGRDSIIMKAGNAYMEPPNVKMTGHNHSGDTPVKLVIFYVSDPDTPFLDLVHK